MDSGAFESGAELFSERRLAWQAADTVAMATSKIGLIPVFCWHHGLAFLMPQSIASEYWLGVLLLRGHNQLWRWISSQRI